MTIASQLKSTAKSLMLAFGMAAAANAAATETPPVENPSATTSNIYFFVKLDNRWYDVFPVGNLVAKIEPYMGLVVPGAVMENCPAGSWTPFAFWYGPDIMPVFEVDRMTYTVREVGTPPTTTKIAVFDISTRLGNAQCLHEVPSPWPDQLFRNGFEITGTQQALRAPMPQLKIS